MSNLVTGLWRAPQNTKVAAQSHILSYRVSGLNLTIGQATQNFILPSTTFNSATYTQVQAPNNYAITASPVLPSNEPQQGLRLFVSKLVVRDLNGSLFPSFASGALASNTAVSLYDSNYSSAGVYTASTASGFTNQGPAAANTLLTVQGLTGQTAPAAPVGNQVLQFVVDTGATQTYGTTGNAIGLIVVQPYDQLGISVTPAVIGTAASPVQATATAFTVDVFGYWAQAI